MEKILQQEITITAGKILNKANCFLNVNESEMFTNSLNIEMNQLLNILNSKIENKPKI